MRKKIIPLLIAVCFTATAQNNSTTASQAPIYITHVTVIDTETGKQAADQTVMISEGRISDVANSQNVAVPANAHMVNGQGKYLIPGLWDMHVRTWDYESTYPLYIANGVTGVREMFEPPNANKFRAELAAKHLIAPHIYLGSPIVDGKPPVWPDSIAVGTADEARRAVDEQKQRGADFIKVYSLLSRDAYFAIVDEARRQYMPVDGHVPNSLSVWEVTAAKQRTIEHLFGMELGCSSCEKELRPKFLTANPAKKEWDAMILEAWQSYCDSRCKALFAQLKKNGTWPVPTLVVRHSFGLLNDPQFSSDNRVRYFSGEFRDWLTGKVDPRMKESSASDFAVIKDTFIAEEKVTGELFRAGVPILAGTDVGNPFCFPGFSLHDELALLVKSGLTPLAALQAATRNAAIFMNATDHYGSVSKGKIGDLVLLDADPLQDIHNTSKISEVFLSEFDRAALDQLLKDAETAPAVPSNDAASGPRTSDKQAPTTDAAQPSPEMRSLSKALAGKWSISEKYEPDEWTPNGGTGYGEEVWRWGPGGFTFMEEIHDHTPSGEQFGVGFSWWDKNKGLQGLWCVDTNPQGCDLQSAVSGFGPKWDGKQLVIHTEFPRDGKNFVWHEVFSDITPTSFTQTADIGEKGGPLKRWLTIHATRIQETPVEHITNNSGETELRAVMAERRKASMEGDTESIANSMTDDYLQTDINGYRQDKTAWLNEYFRPLASLIKAGKFRWDEYEQKNLRLRFYGNSAVVTGELQAKGTGAKPGPQHTWIDDPNAGFSGTLHFTHVYVKQNGKWMLAALHNQMPLPPANAAK